MSDPWFVMLKNETVPASTLRKTPTRQRGTATERVKILGSKVEDSSKAQYLNFFCNPITQYPC